MEPQHLMVLMLSLHSMLLELLGMELVGLEPHEMMMAMDPHDQHLARSG